MNPEELQRRLLAAFGQESADILERVGQCLVALEHTHAGDQSAHVNQLFRELHTLKGSASAVGFDAVKRLAHRLEDLFGELRDSDRTVDLATLDRIHGARAELERACAGEPIDVDAAIAGLSEDAPPRPRPRRPPAPAKNIAPEPSATKPSASEPSPPRPAAPPEFKPDPGDPVSAQPRARAPGVSRPADTIRVPMTKLDTLQSMIGELVVVRLQQESMNEQLRELSRELTRVQSHWALVHGKLRDERGGATGRGQHLESQLARHTAELRELQRQAYGLASRSSAYIAQLGLLSTALEDRLQDIRMLPVGPFFESFGIPMRELGRGLGKRVRLECVDRNIEMDRLVLERLRDPLLHLLRNAVGHGLETPQARALAGKPEVGVLGLEAQFEGERVCIRVSDDGRGIDRAAALEAARSSTFADGVGEQLDDAALIELLCQPGFTTRDEVDDVSGRGVGLDAVRDVVIELRGELAVVSPGIGQGTTFSLTVPASLKTTQGLVVEAGPYTFGVPVDAVDRVVRVQSSDITQLEGVDVLHVDDAPVAWTTLAALLGYPEHSPNIAATRQPTLVLRSGAARLAISVDDVPDEIPLVIKALSPQFERVGQFTGAAIQADGSVLVVLEPRELIRLASGMPSAKAAAMSSPVTTPERPSAEARQRTILVVDDSITTRTLERNILESAGYRVLVAVDGAQALELLWTEDDIELVVTDVQMPHMDGLELCRRVRAGQRSDLPLIIVTSLGDEREQAAGLEAGADAYIVKGNFQQQHFLSTVRRLAGEP